MFHCSFCGKHQRETAKLIAGPNVFICDECVYSCVDILKEDGIPDRVRSNEIPAGMLLASTALQPILRKTP